MAAVTCLLQLSWIMRPVSGRLWPRFCSIRGLCIPLHTFQRASLFKGALWIRYDSMFAFPRRLNNGVHPVETEKGSIEAIIVYLNSLSIFIHSFSWQISGLASNYYYYYCWVCGLLDCHPPPLFNALCFLHHGDVGVQNAVAVSYWSGLKSKGTE